MWMSRITGMRGAALFKQYEGIWENMQNMQENSIATDSTVTSTNNRMHSQVLSDLVVYGKTAQILKEST